MTSPPADVSVIIPAWKAATFIENAVQSVLVSRGVAVQVVIVDDASPDETWPLLQNLASTDPRIIVDRLPGNSGPSAARNRAITLSTGRFIAVVDADDAIAPDRLARLVAMADASAADIVVDNMLEVSSSGAILGPFLKSPDFASRREITLECWIARNHPLKPGDCLGYLKPVFRRQTLDRLGVAYDASLRNSEDYYFVANLLAAGARMIYTPEPGYRYTRAAGSTSHRLKPEQTQSWLDAECAFVAAHEKAVSDPVRRALARRARVLRNVNHMVAATEALKSARVGAFLKLLASDIPAAAYTLRTLAGVAMRRVFRRHSATPPPA